MTDPAKRAKSVKRTDPSGYLPYKLGRFVSSLFYCSSSRTTYHKNKSNSSSRYGQLEIDDVKARRKGNICSFEDDVWNFYQKLLCVEQRIWLPLYSPSSKKLHRFSFVYSGLTWESDQTDCGKHKNAHLEPSRGLDRWILGNGSQRRKPVFCTRTGFSLETMI